MLENPEKNFILVGGTGLYLQSLMLGLPKIPKIREGLREELEKKAEAGASKEELFAELDRIWQPVYDYNCVIGVWGQIEQRHQTYYVRLFCQKAGIPIPERPARRFMWMKRIYEHLGVVHRGAQEQIHARKNFYEGGYPFMDEYDEIIDDLAKLGVIEKFDDGKIGLVDWETYKYDFCI